MRHGTPNIAVQTEMEGKEKPVTWTCRAEGINSPKSVILYYLRK